MNTLKFIVCVLLIVSCKHQNVNSRENIPFETISIETPACEGNCPVYSMVFSSEGKAIYKGKLNVIKEGDIIHQFSKVEMAELFQKISIIDFGKLNDKYESGIADLPEILITYKEQQIIIKDLRTAPKTLKDLVIKLQELARSIGYIN